MKSLLKSVLPACDRSTVQLCEAHGEPASLYCDECKQSICQQCTTSGHLDHRYGAQASFFTGLIRDELAKLVEEKGRLGVACEKNQQVQQQVQDEKAHLSTQIVYNFEELSRILEERKSRLLTTMNEISGVDLRVLSAQEETFKTIQSKIQKLEEEAEMALSNVDHLDEPRARQLLHDLRCAIRQCAGMCLDPKTASQVKLKANMSPYFKSLCSNEFKLFIVKDLSKCTVEGLCPTASVRVPANATVHVRTSNGEICRDKAIVDVTLNNVSMGVRLPCNVYEAGPGMFEFSYCSVYRGQHNLVVEVNGNPIPGSPFNVFVSIPPAQLVNPQRAIALNATNSIAFGADNVMMANVGGAEARIVVMDAYGKHICDIQNTIRMPYSLAVDSENNIYAVDYTTRSLLKFSIQGNVLKSFSREKFPGGQFSGIGEIQIIKDELVFVCDTTQHKIHILDKTLEYLRCIECTGCNLSHSPEPSDLVYHNADQVLYVADSKNKCILVYTLDGAFIRCFGNTGLPFSDVHRLVKPWSVCLDESESLLYVLDCAEHQVLTFTTAGRFVAAFGSTHLLDPARVAVDKDGYVYVCDEGGNRIVVF